MRLTGVCFKQLRDALNAAFNENSLRAMLRIELNQDFDAIVERGPRLTRIEHLIRWAEQNGRLPDLLTAAQTANPTNQQLAAVQLDFTAGDTDTAVPRREDGDQIEVRDINDATAVAIGRGATATVNQYITQQEQPDLFAGVPSFPRYGLIGRDDLLQDLITRLTTGQQPVSLSASGTGGIGKTALAVAAAYHKDLLAHFTDGVLWASVGPQGDPLLELNRWAAALGLDPAQYPDPGDLKRAVMTAIGRRSLLLVIDDIWHDAHAQLLRCGGPNCAHLLTTRKNKIARTFAGRANALNVPDLDPDPAFELLRTIAEEVVTADEPAVRDLLHSAGGLPLVVELLGGYLVQEGAPDPELFPDISQERIKALGDPALRLAQAQARLEDLSGAEQMLAEVLALSLDGFDDEETAAYYALGAIAPKPATFGRAAAEAVTGTDGSFLSRLVNRNLLEIERKSLSMHQALHDLAEARMDNSAQARHADYYLALVNEDRKDWRRIDAAYDQIRWAWNHIDDDNCVDWVYALTDHQLIRGYWFETMTWQERARLVAQKDKDLETESWIINNLALLNDNLGKRAEALSLYEEALRIDRELDDRAGEATTLNNMAMVYDATGRPSEALALYEEALPIRREVGDRAGEATTLNNMGMVYRATGRPDEALALYEEALPISREVGDRAGEATTLNNMAGVYRATGRPSEALALYEQALPILREAGDRAGEAATLGNMALLLEQLERIQEAIDLTQEAIALFHDGLTHASGGVTVEAYEKLLQELQAQDNY